MVKVLIVDDEAKARNLLHHYILNLLPDVGEILTAGSVAEARAAIRTFRPHLIFLDVEMPEQSGLTLLKAYKKPSFDVIFVTAHNKYAIQALRLDALDYLLKPIDPDELVNAFNRFKIKAAERKKEKLRRKPSGEKKSKKEFRLTVHSSEGVFFFNIDEIMRLEADRNYTVIYLKDKRPFVASKTLKYFDDILTRFNFMRTHKTHLVNPAFVVRISHNHDSLILSDGTVVHVSRRKKDEVRKKLKIR